MTDVWFEVKQDAKGNIIILSNMNEADFVKWQAERQRDKEAIKALTDMVCDLQDDVRYWQNAAMSHVVR